MSRKNNTIMISRLGMNIRKIRIENGLSIAKLAKLAEVGSSTISQIETGSRQALHSDTLTKIANVLNVSLEMLLENENTATDNTSTSILTLYYQMNHTDKLELDEKELTAFEREIIKTQLATALQLIRLNRETEEKVNN